MEAVFLDRDGTINEEVDNLDHPRHLRLIRGVSKAIRRLNEGSISVVVVSNQAGVARGERTEQDVEITHEAISKELKKEGAHIDAFYYCPHHPEGSGEYAVECDCRKPKPGLLLRAAKDLKLDLSRSVMVGDTARDIEAGIRVGCKTILVLTGQGAKVHATWDKSFKPSYVAKDLPTAVHWILEEKN